MKSREVIQLKAGQEFYIVLMSNNYSCENPFLRHQSNRPSYYQKPLGIFKTSIKEITENKHTYDWVYFKAKLDTSEFDNLIWRGHYDDIPEGKIYTDYAQWFMNDEVYCMVYDDIKQSNTHEHTSENMFMTYEEAKAYFDKKMKAFKKNMKTYAVHLEDEIKLAEDNIVEAKKQIEKINQGLNNI